MLRKTKQLYQNHLAYQIFFSFILIVTLMFTFLSLVPFWDARTFVPLETREKAHFQWESQLTQKEYNLNEIFDRELAINTPNGYDLILLEPATGEIIGVTEQQLNILQLFIFKANNPAIPLKRQFNAQEFYGPFLVQSKERTYYQYFFQSINPQLEALNTLFDSPWLISFLVLLISLPIVLFQSHRIAKPIQQLRITAQAVATGNFIPNPRIESEGIVEFRQVGTSINHMISALQKLQSYQQRLISDISHELKTPLTRMQLALSLLRRRNGESKEVERLENEITKLDAMIQDLLKLSRQNLNHHTQRAVFSINQIWDNILTDAQFELGNSGFDFVFEQQINNPAQYQINGNLALLSSAVENVVRNAKKYAHKHIHLTTYIGQKQFLNIVIDDDGEGVPDDQYEEIFRPFHRVNDDRARQTGGTGLGLAIVANAVENHQGIVNAERSPRGGLRVKIQLPLWSG